MLLSLRSLASLGALLLSGSSAAAAAVDTSAQLPLLPRQQADGAWPYAPWSTDGRDVKNARGQSVTPVGFNWPGSGETMVPEGLRYVGASTTVKRLADLGFNFARHTYAIQMIDEIYANNGTDISLETAFLNGLGSNGTRVLQEILDKNADMGWTKETTRLQVWDSIAKLEAEHGIVMHPDVHVSKAKWCCGNDDGNAWFGDLYFDVENWKRGLSYMANWAKNHSNVVSISLHNELRPATGRPEAEYTWLTWAGNMTAGADAIHEANSDLLITFSGLQYDQDLSAVVQEANLNIAPAFKIDPVRDGRRREPVYFKIDEHAWANKAVLELHLYDQSADADTGSCEAIQAQLYYYGFSALGMDPPSGCAKEGEQDDSKYPCPAPARKTPVWLTEFGQAQDSTLNNATLANCLRQFTLDHKIGWAVWSIAGSYYTRQGTQDLDDTWALLNHEWTDWRDSATIESYWKPYIAAMGTTNIEKNSTAQA